MAEYRSEPYLAGGEVERNYDYPPMGTNKVWDHEETPWVRNPVSGEWMPVGLKPDAARICDWEGLLDEFGPVNDTPPGVSSCQ